MQIGDVHVRGLGSEQVATVLRQSGSHVRLIVARSVTEPFPMSHPHAPIVPTEQLDEHLHQLYSALLAYENAQSLGLTPEQLEQLSMMGQLPENFLHGNAVSNSFEVHMAVSKLLNNRTVSLSERQNLYGSTVICLCSLQLLIVLSLFSLKNKGGFVKEHCLCFSYIMNCSWELLLKIINTRLMSTEVKFETSGTNNE